MPGPRRIIRVAIWIAIVVGGCAMHLPQRGVIIGVVVAVLAPVLGALKGGPKALLTAAAAIVLLTGVLALATRGDRRDPSLPACLSLLDGGSYDSQYDRTCFESSSDQALRGVVPAAIVLLFGFTTGGFRFAADYGDREFKRRSEELLRLLRRANRQAWHLAELARADGHGDVVAGPDLPLSPRAADSP